jgi:hypothetical protein
MMISLKQFQHSFFIWHYFGVETSKQIQIYSLFLCQIAKIKNKIVSSFFEALGKNCGNRYLQE